MATALPQLGKSGKYGDLKKRLMFLLGALIVFRIGAHIPVPGIDPNELAQLFQRQQGGILGLFNMFSHTKKKIEQKLEKKIFFEVFFLGVCTLDVWKGRGGCVLFFWERERNKKK